MPRPKKIRDPKNFQVDFWNYLVNPITGYHIESAHLSKRASQERKKWIK